jgi:hypothetical protein
MRGRRHRQPSRIGQRHRHGRHHLLRRLEVKAGEPVELVVKADEPGELHVHSTPEQEFEYGAGTTTLELTLDQPGVVDVEAHDPKVVIVQLEVS